MPGETEHDSQPKTAVAAVPTIQEQHLETVKVWAEYSKDRYDTARQLFDEFRNRARQLIPLVGVVLSIELSFVVRLLLDHDIPIAATFRRNALVVFAIAISIQFILLPVLLVAGFGGRQKFWEPEDPVTLADYILGKGELEVTQMVAAYYAKACKPYVDAGTMLGMRVSMAVVLFTVSVLFLLGAVVTLGVGNLSSDPGSGNVGSTSMAEPTKPSASNAPAVVPKAPTPTPVPSAPSPTARPAVSPPPNPLVATPTRGIQIRGSRSGSGDKEA